MLVSINFNPPAPRGARPCAQSARRQRRNISIHPPLAGRDARDTRASNPFRDFNPPAPRGARLAMLPTIPFDDAFQSTRPSRGETPVSRETITIPRFQSTRPSRGETRSTRTMRQSGKNFNPPAPRGARLHLCWYHLVRWKISIHPPLAGRDHIH